MKLKFELKDDFLKYDLKKMLGDHYKDHQHQLTFDFAVDYKGNVHVQGLKVISQQLKAENTNV